MNSFDQTIISLFNRFAQHSWTVDTLIMTISDSDLLKGYLSLPLLWWAWFRGPRQDEDRRTVLLTIVGALSAVAVARLLQLTLPFRSRPIHTAGLQFTIPYSMPPDFLDGWSSFPSDHASLFLRSPRDCGSSLRFSDCSGFSTRPCWFPFRASMSGSTSRPTSYRERCWG
ncbi:MAG: hypothetical protein MRJ92_09470 [Nitrospira sp.]|nr:hypothetical protein [Nitrospira sp.]